MKNTKKIVLSLVCAGSIIAGSQAQALSFPGSEKVATYLAGAVADTLVEKMQKGEVISNKEMCKKGNAINLTKLYKVRSVKEAKKVIGDSVSIRMASGLLASASKTVSALGLLACKEVKGFDNSQFAKNARKKFSDTVTDKELKNAVSSGILKSSSNITAFACTSIIAGLLATQGGIGAIPYVSATCATTVHALHQAAKAKK